MNTYTKQECLDIAAGYQRDIDSLIKRYGSGVRPGWVSTDIAISADRRDYWEQIAADMEAAE